MRYLLLSSAVLLAGFVAAAAAETPNPSRIVIGGAGRPEPIKRTVYLDHVVLEELRKSNPGHYARIEKVMAAAGELCAPNAARQWEALNVKAGSCSGMVVKTSLPPKREIGFQIDDTRYIALVTIREAPALFVPVPGKVVPADRKPAPK